MRAYVFSGASRYPKLAASLFAAVLVSSVATSAAQETTGETAPAIPATAATTTDSGPAIGADASFRLGLDKAFKSWGLLDGIDLSELDRSGRRRTVDLGDKGSLLFFRLNSDGSDDSDEDRQEDSDTQMPATVKPPQPGGEQPAAAPTTPVTSANIGTPAAPTPPSAETPIAPETSTSLAEPDPLDGRFYVSYELDNLRLAQFSAKTGKEIGIDLELTDAVFIFSSEAHRERLSKLALPAKTGKYLRQFLDDKRYIDLPAGGLLFGKLVVRDNPFFDHLDGTLNFKEDDIFVKGVVGPRMLRRVLGLKVKPQTPDIGAEDLNLSMSVEGFRPRKIGRYVDAQDVAFTLKGDNGGKLVMDGTARARFGIGARKVKVHAKIAIDPNAADEIPVFKLTAEATKDDLRRIKVGKRDVTELAFEFSLDKEYTPKLHAEGKAGEGDDEVPISGELDDEDGRDLFALDGSTLEAISGLDIPGLDEIKFPDLPKLNTARAITLETKVRNKPASVVIGPVANDEASYVALLMEGGLESLLPGKTLADIGDLETGRSIFIYVPKGRGPPTLSALPADLRDTFERNFSADDLADAKTGLNIFQASKFPERHPFSRALNLFRSNGSDSTGMQIVGRINPLIFDEPEDDISETWGGSRGAATLKTILSSVEIEGRVKGLDGLGVGSFFRLADTASFEFGAKSGSLGATLKFAGRLKLRGARTPRNFEFLADQRASGQFAWRGVEVDEDGVDIKGGQQIRLDGRIVNNRPQDIRIALQGGHRLGDLFATQFGGLSDLEVRDVSLSRGFVQAAVSRGAETSQIVIVDKEGVQLAVVAISGKVRPASYIPGLDKTPLADLVLPNSIAMIAGANIDRDAITQLPGGMGDTLLASLDGAGIAPEPGISFLSRLTFEGDDPLAGLVRRLGVPASGEALLHGKIPAGVVQRIAGGAKPKAADLAGLNLTAKLPRLKLPGIGTLFELNDTTELVLAVDKAGTPGVSARSQGVFTLPIVKTSEQVTLAADIMGTGADREVLVEVNSSTLNGDGEPRLKIYAAAPLALNALKSVQGFVASVENGLTLSDLIGQDVPGIGGLALSEAKLSLNHISGTLALGDARLNANIASLGDGPSLRQAILTLEAENLPGASLIPGINKTPLKSIHLDHGLIAYIPQVPGGEGTLPVIDLPESMRALVAKLDGAEGGAITELQRGLNLISLVDSNNLGPLKTVLDKLQSRGGGKKFRLTASMPADALAFAGEKLQTLKAKLTKKKSNKPPLRERIKTAAAKASGKAKAAATKAPAKVKALAAKLLPAVIKKVKVTIPVPAIKLPGIDDYLSSDKAQIRVVGSENPETKIVALTTSIASKLAFAVPGTPTRGTVDSDLVIVADSGKNLTVNVGGAGRLENVAAEMVLAGTFGIGEARPDLAIEIAGSGLTLGALTGLDVPGVTELALNRATVKAGELSGEVELRGAVTKAAAFGFTRTAKPVLALATANVDAARFIPGVEGSVLDAAVLDNARFLFVPAGRGDKAADLTFPAIFADTLAPESIKDGLNTELRVAPKDGTQLANLLNGIGLKLDGPLEIEGRLPTNLFTAPKEDVLPNVRLAAVLPRLTFNNMGAVQIAFSDAPRLTLEGSAAGMAGTVETGLSIELPTISRTFKGTGSFKTAPKEDGGRELRFLAETTDPGGRTATIEAGMDLPGSPRDFRLKFAGEQTLSSLLGVDIPVIGDLNLSELEKGPDFLVAKIKLKSALSTVGAFKSGERWVVAVSAAGLKPAEFIPGLDDLPGKNLALPEAMFVFVPPRLGGGGGSGLPFDVAALPGAVRDGLKDVLAPFGGGSTPLRGGLNLISLIDPSKIPALAKTLSFTGSGSSRSFKLTGLLPTQSLKALTAQGSAFKGVAKDLVGKLIAGVDLDTELPAVNLPGVREVVTFGDPHLRIKGDDTGGELKLAMGIEGDMRLTLPNVQPLDLAGKLAIAAAREGVALDVSGYASPGGRAMRVGGRVLLARENPRLQLAFMSEVTVGDLIGDGLPAISDLALVDARFGSEIISGTVQFRGAKTTLAAFDYKRDKKPFVALLSENVDAANFIPGISGSPLDNASLASGALVYVPGGKSDYPKSEDYPDNVTEALRFVSRDYDQPASAGLKAGFDIEFKDGAPLTQALQFVGYKETAIRMTGNLPTDLLTAGGGSGVSASDARRAASRGAALAGTALKAAIRGVDLEAQLPALNLPGIDKVVHFGDPLFRIKGAEVVDVGGNATGEVKLRVGVDGDMTLKLPSHNLAFAGGFDIEKTSGGKAFKLALYSTSRLDWQRAFGIPFVDLNGIGMAGTVERTSDGKARLVASLSSQLKIDRLQFNSTAAIGITASGLPEVRFTVDNKIRMADLPGMGGIPGINEIAFDNLWVGTGGLGGRIEISKLGLGGEGALFLQGGKPVMLVRADQMTLGNLLGKGGPIGDALKQMWDPFLGIKFPQAVFAMSTADLSRVKLSALPEAVQPILSNMVSGGDSELPIGKGISLMAGLSEKDLPASIRDAVTKEINVFDAVDGPLLLAGSINGLFDGNLEARLAVKLPDFKLPGNQPWQKIVSVERAGAEGFMFLDVPKTQFGLGVSGNIGIDVPQIGNEGKSDKLKFRGDLYTAFDAVSWAGSFKVAGTMQGEWNSPFGLNDAIAIENPAILVGVDSEGSVEFGIGGNSEFRGLRGGKNFKQYLDMLVNINFSTSFPLPKKLAFGYRIDGEVSDLTVFEIQEAYLKGFFTGPMAGEIIKLLPDQKSRDVARFLQAELKNRSLFDLMQLDKIPLPLFKYYDPYIYFATPGAKLPGREDTLDTIGARVAGALGMEFMGKNYRFGGMDMRLTLSDGLIMKGDLADVNLAPGGTSILSLKNAKMDIVANIKQIPHFKLSGDINLLGAKESIDVELSKDRIAFHYDKDLGPIIKIKVDAETDSGDVIKAREFIVTASTKTEIDTLMTDKVLPAMGIPKVIGDMIAKKNPLFINGARFKGKLVHFLKGNPVTLEIDHKFFGTEMEPAVAEVVPVWTDPLRAFPTDQVAKAMAVSFFKYVRDHPIELGRVNLGLVSIDGASLTATSDGSNRFKLNGKLSALGLPFSETTVILDDASGVTLDSWTEVNLQLPLGPLGNLGKSRTDLHYELNPNALSHAIDLKVSTAALGYEDYIYFNFRGDMDQTTVTFYSTNPCAKFRSSSELSAGDLRNFAFKASQDKVTPIDLIKLVQFKPDIQLPSPKDALACGGRVLAIVGNVAEVVNQGLQEIDKASKEVIKFAGNLANEIFKGLTKLAGCLSKHGCAHNFEYDEVLLRDFRDRYAADNYCADIRGQKARPDTDIIIYPCHMRWNQAFILEGGAIKSVRREGGSLPYCFGTRNYRNNGQVVLVKCWWTDAMLRFDFRANGQVRAKRYDGSGDLCLATRGGNLVVQTCPDANDRGADKWAAFEPKRGAFKNPAGERDAAIMRAAYRSKETNDKAVPFYRFEDPRTLEQRHTWKGRQYAESSQWHLDDRLGLIFPTRVRGTVPLFIYERLWDGKTQHAFATDPKKFAGGAEGLSLEGVAGYLYPDKFAGSIPLHLYEHRSKGDFVLRTKMDLGGDWRHHGIAGYGVAPPPPPGDNEPFETSNPELLAGTDALVFPKRAEDTVAVYKYTNPGNGDVLYTTDFGELGAGDPWFTYGGIAGWVFPDERAGTIPLYRYSSKSRHDFTVDPKKRNGTRGGGGYTFESVIGYAIGSDYGPDLDTKVVAANAQPFLRYFNPSSNDHMYTADPQQLGDGDDGYVRDGIAGGIFRGRAKGTVPLYRYWNDAKKDHIYTSRFQDLWYGKDGYEYVGVEGYIYPSERQGTIALHRYVNNATHDNILTTDFDEFDGRNGRNGFAYVGVEGWVPAAPTPADAVKVAAVKPVDFVRYRHPASGDHRLAAGVRVAAAERDGYRLDRVLSSILTERAKGTIPLYEYVKGNNADSLYTSAYTELGPGRHGYAYKGIAGWVYPDEIKNGKALHRYGNLGTGDHLLTSDFTEFNGASGKDGYRYEGIVGWVPPFKAPGADAPIVNEEPKLLARYVNAQTGDHRMVLGLEELGEGKDGYEIEAIHGRMWAKRAKDTVPVYHYYNRERGDHLLTHTYDEFWQGRDGYTYEGVLGYVLAKEARGSVALHRYFSRARLDTLLTTNFDELSGRAGAQGYNYARIEGWVLPFQPPGTDTKIEKSDPVPLVRYKDVRRNTFAFAAGSGVYGTRKGELAIGRAQGRIFTKRAEGTKPLYRYVHRSGSRTFTSDFGELMFGKRGFKFEGVVGYVYEAERAGAIALHRFENASQNASVLTVDIDEFGGTGGKDGYIYKGIIGWVPEYPDRPVAGFENFYLATHENFSCLDSDERPDTILTSRLCTADDDLRFALWQDGSIRHNSSSLCLGVMDGNTDRTALSTIACDYTDAQQWEVRWAGRKPSVPDGQAQLQLIHKASGKCLGLENASAYDGVEADLYPCEKPGDNVQTWVASAGVPAYVIPGTNAPVNPSEPEWLVRYVSPKSKIGDHVVANGFTEYGRGRDGYEPELLMGRIHTTRGAQDMVPLYRYLDAKTGDHLLTADFLEHRFGDDGYRFEKVAGYVFPAERQGASAMHQYVNKTTGDTLIATNFREWSGASGRDGYRYQGVVGWTPATNAQAPAPWNRVYLANRGGMVCLVGDDGNGISSARCEETDNQWVAFFSDGTVRFGGEGSCLEAGLGDDTSVYAADCSDNLTQRWDVVWQGAAPVAADGKKPLQLKHWRSGRCLRLEDGAGVDGIRAQMSDCTDFAADDRRGTWWAHAAPPVFVAPGTDALIAVSKPLPLIAYHNDKTKGGDHRLATGPQELGLGKDGYEMLTAQGRILPARAAGTVPLYRYRSVDAADHDFTADFRRHGWGYAGYAYEGIAGYVFADQASDRVALHAYVNESKKDHLLTTDAQAFGGERGHDGYVYTGVEAWVPRYPEEPRAGYDKLYLSTNKHLSCLDAEAKLGAPLRSSFCGDHEKPQFTFWQDGTLRHDESGQCLSPAGKVQDGTLAFARCAYTDAQQFEVRWADAASAPDGTSMLQVVHKESGRCIGLADASGQDGVAARLMACETPGDNVQTWIAGKEKPVFVAPGMADAVTNAKPKIFIRYAHQNRANGNHMMQVGPEPYGLGKDGYDMQLAQGWIFPSRAADTVPLYRYIDVAKGDTLYTSDFHEFRYARGGAAYDGIVGFVYTDERPGAVALHRYVNAAKGDHVLSSYIDEFGGKAGKNGYKHDGIVGWVPHYDENPVAGLKAVHLATNKNLSCLDAENTAGGKVASRFCETPGDKKFTAWKDGSFRHDASGLCLTLRGQIKQGDRIRVERCSYTTDQQWTIDWPAGDPGAADGVSALKLVHKDSGLCAGLSSGSGQDGVEAAAFRCADAEPDLQAFVAETKQPVFVVPGMEVAEEPNAPLPFIRYVKRSARNGDHLMQVGPEPFGLGRDGYDMELAQGRIFAKRAPETVPLYRYIDKAKGDTIYTRDFHEFRYAKDDVTYDGVFAYLYGTERKGAVALYRYSNKLKGDHLLTTSLDEYGAKAGKDGYGFDGVIGYVPPYPEEPRKAFQAMYVATNGNLSCLNAEAKDGAPLRSSFCEDHAAGQISFWQDGTVRHDGGNLCLDLPAKPRNGTTVTLARCAYTDNQQWKLDWRGSAPGAADGTQTLSLVHAESGMCVGLRDGSGQDGVEAAAFKCGKAERGVQTWYVSTSRPSFVPPETDAPVAANDPVPFVRYAKRSGAADHLMMPGFEELGISWKGYDIENPQGLIYRSRAKGTVPLYRYLNAKTGHHVYTRDFHEFRYAHGAITYDGAVGFVYGEDTGDLVALHRYDDVSAGDQILTTDFQTLGGAQGRGGYAYRGIAAWVPPYAAKPVGPLDGVYAVGEDWMCLVPVAGAANHVALTPCAEKPSWRLSLYDDDTLRPAGSELCLAMGDEAVSGGLEPCVYRSPRQVVDILWNGNGRAPKKADGSKAFRVRHAQSSKCLATVGSAAKAGTRLQLAVCGGSGGRAGQNWKPFQSFPSAKPVKSWQSLQIAGGGGLCLGDDKPGDGSDVQLRDCDGRARVTFSLFADSSVRHDRSGLCLTVPAGSDSRTPLKLSACLINSPTQSFEIAWNGDNKAPDTPSNTKTFRISHPKSGLCVRSRGGNWADGNTVTLTKCGGRQGRDDQNWSFKLLATQ